MVNKGLEPMSIKELIDKWEYEHKMYKIIDHQKAILIKSFIQDLKNLAKEEKAKQII